ncbi:Protein kinase-like domain [Pseudocohnilembus persalinus]|uniref:Protein kinase-like domain n=1 Tax=Pseudocohnilembus persalinus TaxID=266149 RepID=A0A0V0QDB6_PSEPJ|nr:Protein kinase-like domain [Pseudocohnilembus persalinus]|eukprot:KRX00178.1 Protein kinase-like domain [Pseudocohnilembus persalinus]
MGQAIGKMQQNCCGSQPQPQKNQETQDLLKNQKNNNVNNDKNKAKNNNVQQGSKQGNQINNSNNIINKKDEQVDDDQSLNQSDSQKDPNDSEQQLEEPKKLDDLQGFLKIKQIGQGAFGKVYTVKKNDPNSKKIYAMKIMRKTDILKYGLLAYVQTEKETLLKNSHKFIVNLNYSFQTNSKVYLVMEYIEGGSLYPYLQNLSRKDREPIARFVMAQLIVAIEVLHKQYHLIYRDLKPENILVTEDGNIKVTDFGLSKKFDPNSNEKFKGTGGTQEYFAPEVVLNQGWDRCVDIWGMGIFLYEMLAGQCPFIPEKRKGLTQNFIDKIVKVQVQYPAFFSKDAIDLISKILQKEPMDRLGAKNFEDLKTHKFFQGIDWKQLEECQLVSPLKKYVQKRLEVQNKSGIHLPARPILETYINDPQLQIQGFTYRGKLE